MPKRFAFRLQKVLDYRGELEESKKRELFLTRKAVAEQNQRLMDLMKEGMTLRQKIKTMRMAAIDIQALRMEMGYMSFLDRRTEAAHARLQELAQTEKRIRMEYIEARRKVRALEILKDRHHGRYQYDLNRAEVRELDEVGQNIYVRSRA